MRAVCQVQFKWESRGRAVLAKTSTSVDKGSKGKFGGSRSAAAYLHHAKNETAAMSLISILKVEGFPLRPIRQPIPSCYILYYHPLLKECTLLEGMHAYNHAYHLT